MANIFSIDDATKLVIQGALDDLLANTAVGGLGKSCRLVYPPKFVTCTNCVIDPIGGKSANRPRSGAPVPFTAGQPCPMCSGKGQKAIEATEEITLKCAWEPKRFILPIPATIDFRVPNSVLETKGYLKDMPKLMKCDYLVVDLPIEPFLRLKFKLVGEPGDPSNIVQGRYCVALWKRFNG